MTTNESPQENEAGKTYCLSHDISREGAARMCRTLPDEYTVSFSSPKQTRKQSKHYHGLIADIAEQYLHEDRYWSTKTMKLLLLAQFRLETKDFPELKDLWNEFGKLELIPSLNGEDVIALGDQTRSFPKHLATAFIDWLLFFGSENGIQFSAPKGEDQESITFPDVQISPESLQIAG